jgi:hypothetical protein
VPQPGSAPSPLTGHYTAEIASETLAELRRGMMDFT